MGKYVLTALFSGVISAFSQVLLKKSSSLDTSKGLREYLNPYVIGGYLLVLLCMFLMIAAYRGLPFKYGAVLEALVYLYVMVLSKLFFNETITLKRVVGNLMILCGVAVFSMN